VLNLAERQPSDQRPVAVSALTGEGMDRLVDAIEGRLSESRQTIEVSVDPADGAGLSWLYRHSEVLAKDVHDDGRLTVTVRADADNAARVRAKFNS
jgi:GTP-binding protein HflX